MGIFYLVLCVLLVSVWICLFKNWESFLMSPCWGRGLFRSHIFCMFLSCVWFFHIICILHLDLLLHLHILIVYLSLDLFYLCDFPFSFLIVLLDFSIPSSFQHQSSSMSLSLMSSVFEFCIVFSFPSALCLLSWASVKSLFQVLSLYIHLIVSLSLFKTLWILW